MWFLAAPLCFHCVLTTSQESGEVKFPRAPPASAGLLYLPFFLCVNPAEAESLFHGFQHQTDALAAMSGAREPGGESVSRRHKRCRWFSCTASRLNAGLFLCVFFADRNTEQWPQKLIMQLIPQQLLVRFLCSRRTRHSCLWMLCQSCVCVCFDFRPL